MSNSKQLYWTRLNEMLRNDEIEFDQVTAPEMDLSELCLSISNPEHLKKGVQFALDHFNEIAKLEYEFNDGQPPEITLKHLEWAKVYIESNKCSFLLQNLSDIIGKSSISVGEFLFNCHLATQLELTEFKIHTDIKRKALMTYLFGNNFTVVSTKSMENRLNLVDSSCTQIIFESGDVASAIDALIMNVSDRTLAPWRIQSVYVQESLKNLIYDKLTADRLNAANAITGPNATEENRQTCEKLAKRFGGKFICSNNRSILLLFNVPPKYLSSSTTMTFNQIPVAINFFRTTKEVIQLINADFQANKEHLASIWTGDIALYYELAAELNAKILWSNCIGVFDAIMPSLNAQFIAGDDSRLGILINSTKYLLIVYQNYF